MSVAWQIREAEGCAEHTNMIEKFRDGQIYLSHWHDSYVKPNI